jgi:hypothetical protein
MMSLRTTSLLCVLITVVTPSVRAQEQPGGGPLLSYLQVGQYRLGFADETLLVRGRRTVVQTTSIKAVQRMLGSSRVHTSGDASTSLTSVCYRLAGAPAMVLMLESEEMGGGIWLTGFSLLASGARRSREHSCRALAIAPTAVRTNVGLRLGMSRHDVDTLLGLTGTDSAGVVVYERGADRKARTKDGSIQPYTEWAGFEVRFRNGIVVGFRGTRIDAT